MDAPTDNTIAKSGNKTSMSVAFATRCALLALVLGVISAATVHGQAIQPCEATPSSAKTAVAADKTKASVHASQTVVDQSIPNDPAMDDLVRPYADKVRQLTMVIGQLDGDLQKASAIGANTLGHFVTSGMMATARAKLGSRVDVVITNAGGLRKNTIQSGELRASDIFELLPFENALVEVELSGAQLLTLLQRVTEDRNAQAGARIQFRWNEQSRPEFISAKLVDATGNERDIDPAKTYVVVTTDYLMKLNSGNYAILKDGKNAKPLNITIREAVIEYVKAETAAGRRVRSTLDGRFVQIGPDPVRTENRP
jgi:2',3'-cyclic-nucleotide 2'-phosphodiesterase (5'-nucleotidase family)